MIPSQLESLANHLWQSSLFTLAVWLVTLLLRRNRAAVRHGLWLAASVKFLAPLALLATVGSSMSWRKAPVAAVRSQIAAMEEISQPFTALAPPTLLASVPPAPSRIPEVLFGVWLCGFAANSLAWWRRWRRVRAALRAASPLPLGSLTKLPVRAMSSPARLEPGVFGVFRPFLLLPQGITERLTPAQFEAILAHELCHVRRRDNLAAAIHMVVEALFWFHPLVWWIEARMVEERERACDEEVLRMAGDPQDYAEGIVTVCKFYLESPLVCVSGVTGSNLRRRVEAIMMNRAARQLSLGRKVLVAGVGVLATAGPFVVGVVRAQTDAPLAFEVASVRQNSRYSWIRRPWMPLTAAADCDRAFACISGSRFTEKTASLVDLIMDAYNVKRYRIEGLPSWGDSAHDVYDIAAKSPGDAAPTINQIRQMLQSLLADRFRLKLHHATKELPVYALVIAKNGPKLTVSPDGCDIPGFAGQGHAGAKADGGGDALSATARDAFGFQWWPGIPEALSGFTDRPVIDKTGFEASYYCTPDGRDPLRVLAAELPSGSGGRRGDPQSAVDVSSVDADVTTNSVYTIVEEKWGLKLEPRKAPLDVLIIDRVERPSEN